jgi:CRP/FNR family cyclic AMP-dependent transcriptional regulator
VGSQDSVQLAVEQPWLLYGVPEERRAWVSKNLVVPIVRLPAGPVDVDELPRPAVALMVVRGLIARRLEVVGYCGTELLGEADLLRPWTYEGHVATIPATARFRALADVELALLDERFVQCAVRVPELSTALLERSVERARMKGFFLAIRAVVRTEERLLLTLWHLAERWGHVTLDGVVLHLPRVSHDILAEMISARRPSVTMAVKALEAHGALERPSRGLWLLKGDPPQMLEPDPYADAGSSVGAPA